jgi:hypothetical protein
VTRTAAYLQANPDTQAILTLGPTGADPMIKYVKDQGAADQSGRADQPDHDALSVTRFEPAGLLRTEA